MAHFTSIPLLHNHKGLTRSRHGLPKNQFTLEAALADAFAHLLLVKVSGSRINEPVPGLEGHPDSLGSLLRRRLKDAKT